VKAFLAGILAASLLTLAASAYGADLSNVFRAAVGVNGAWLSGDATGAPADVEAGGTVSASLSPHISAVGGAFHGFSHDYQRWDVGGRITATDVNDPLFNAYFGAVYRGGSKAEVGPNEWAPDAGFGWVPNKAWPNVVVGVDASVGAVSKNVLTVAAVRYLFPLK
jgi:hypothetical protein